MLVAYPERSVKFAPGCDAVEMAAHRDGRDRVVFTLEQRKLTASPVDLVLGSERHNLIAEPVSGHLIFGTGTESSNSSRRGQAELGGFVDIIPGGTQVGVNRR